MKLIRKEWPKVREEERGGHDYYYVDARRAGYTGQTRFCFKDRKEALDFASKLAAKVRDTGLSSLESKLDPRMARWQEQAQIIGITLDEIVALGFKVAQEQKEKAASPLMNDLLEMWYTNKEKNKLKELRPDSLRTCRSMANKFKEDFGQVKIADIDRQTVIDYLNGQDCGNVRRNNLRNYLGQFFIWAIGEGHAKVNPARAKSTDCPNGIEIDTTDLSAPEYYRVEQCKAIMREAMKTPEMVPYFALCLFCGIRPAECSRLEWFEDKTKYSGDNWGVNLDSNYIVMPGFMTKTKTGRQFDIPANCVVWLKAYKQNGKPLIPKNFVNARKDIMKALNGSWIQDGMRHTYATYAYAKHHSTIELEHVMGNSPEVIQKFYKGQIADNDVNAFWSITPETVNAK